MRKFLLLVAVVMIATTAMAQNTKGYQYTIDLNNSSDDKFWVELVTPRVKTKTTVFHLPKTVPGTYSNDDYGYFAGEVKAFDGKGNELKVTRLDVNSWQIDDATKLSRITYKVDDTFDDKTRNEKVFEPTGSSVQHDTAYVLNTYTVMGYLQGMEELPYSLTVKHKPDFYGSTALTDNDKSDGQDVFTSVNYHDIADNPILYTRPDTTTIKVGGADILISVYSPNKLITAAFLATKLDSLTKAQVQYLGGKLPVNKYAYLIYLFDKQPNSNAAGALEHSTSSLYSLGESNPEAFAQNFKDVAAHEFFHILTPLSVHSEEIQYFDFTNPKMSEHLWLYEGSTEYHAHKAQLQAKLISVDRFLSVMGSKITSSRLGFNDTLPFTFMSKNVLDSAYEKQYGNVYQKGALINLCIDVKLRELSGGKYGLMNLIQDLSAKYGKGKPFKDSELFAVIGKLTYPEIRSFLETYVSGNKPLPLEEVFAATGIHWTKDTSVQVFSFGGFRARAAGNSIYLAVVNLDEFGKKMDYRVNDTIVSVNGTAVSPKNFGAVSAKIAATSKPGDQLSMEVIRNVNGKPEHITLQQPIEFVPQKRYNILKLEPNATAAQVSLRNAWLQVMP